MDVIALMTLRGRVAERVVLFVGLFAAACTRRSPPDVVPAPLSVEVSGCATVTSDGDCLVGADRTARVFVGAIAAATFTSAEGVVEAEALATREGGRLYKLHLPEGVRAVRVAVAAHADARVSMAIDAPPQWLADVRAGAAKEDAEATLERYRAHRRSTDDREAALAAGQAARIELSRGRIPESVALFREAIDADRRAGRISAAVDDSFALAYTLNERGHSTTEARGAIDAVADLLPRYPDGRAREPYYRGTIASEARDRRLALSLYREAERRASRLGIPRLVQSVRVGIAASLAELGRFDEALDILRAVVRDFGAEATPCDHLSAWSGMGFDLLMLATRDGNDGANRNVWIAQAVEVLQRGRSEARCADGYLHATTLAHLALAALLSGRADDAAASLAAARGRAPDPPLSQSFFWLDLDARISLARHDAARALAAYDELEQRARAALLPEYEWSALVGRGAALEALGRRAEALGAYARAEEKLDDASLSIPLGEGRAAFLVERERSATAAIALLVASKKNDEAFHFARRARRRVLSGLEVARRLTRLGADARARWDAAIDRYAHERASIDAEAALDWKLPVAQLGPAQERRRAREAALRAALEELLSVVAGEGVLAVQVPPSLAAEGEALLLFHPAASGWTGMIADSAKVAVFHVPPFDPKSSGDDLARLLVAPARAQIDHASRLRVLLPGALAQIDFHALPYGDGPLLARLPVEYGLDLGAIDSSAALPRALVVSDPQRNLPEARREGQAVARALRSGAGSVELFEGEGATHALVLDALGRASLFHYAGHATYEGEDGWDSTLPLAAGGKLLVSDVLALRRVPADVVLSGCNAAHTASTSPGDTLGIAQAFLVAGSNEVVAPTRSLDDALSARFVADLYDGLPAAGGDIAKAARGAQLHMREIDPASDWANFRVLRR